MPSLLILLFPSLCIFSVHFSRLGLNVPILWEFNVLFGLFLFNYQRSMLGESGCSRVPATHRNGHLHMFILVALNNIPNCCWIWLVFVLTSEEENWHYTGMWTSSFASTFCDFRCLLIFTWQNVVKYICTFFNVWYAHFACFVFTYFRFIYCVHFHYVG